MIVNRRNFLASSLVALAPSTHAAADESALDLVRAGMRLDGMDIIDAHCHFRKCPPGLVWPRNEEMLMADLLNLKCIRLNQLVLELIF